MRERIGLSGDAIFEGRGKTFRIYSPDVPDEVVGLLASRLREMPADQPVTALLPSRKRARALP